jgi:gas vesicle protein
MSGSWHDILMKYRKSFSSLKFFDMSKLLVGFAAGLVVGVLFAPAKGTDTRDRISQKGRDLKDKFDDLVDSISEKFQTVTDEAEEFTQRAKQRATTAATS